MKRRNGSERQSSTTFDTHHAGMTSAGPLPTAAKAIRPASGIRAKPVICRTPPTVVPTFPGCGLVCRCRSATCRTQPSWASRTSIRRLGPLHSGAYIPQEERMTTDLWALIHPERRALLNDVAALNDEQWNTPSLCARWTVRDTLAHLTSAAKMTPGRYIGSWVRAGFRFN